MGKLQKRKETQAEQSERFRAEVERLVAVGELSPTEANNALDQIVRRATSTLKE